MAINKSKSATTSNPAPAKLWLQSARSIKTVSIEDDEGYKNKTSHLTDPVVLSKAIVPSKICTDTFVNTDIEHEHNATDTHTPFLQLLDNWGACMTCHDGYAHTEALREQARQEARQVEADQAEMKRLQKKRDAAIARKKHKELAIKFAKAEKAAAVARARECRDLAKEAADLKMEQEEQAKEAANARHKQAMIQAYEARERTQMKLREVAEARREMKLSKKVLKKSKKEFKEAKKEEKKEAKQAKRIQKEAKMITKNIKSARKKYDKFDAQWSKRMAKEEAKKAAKSSKLIQQMEEEEFQVKGAQANIASLRRKIKDVDAKGHLRYILEHVDSDTETMIMTILSEDSDIETVVSWDDENDHRLSIGDVFEEASLLLQGK